MKLSDLFKIICWVALGMAGILILLGFGVLPISAGRAFWAFSVADRLWWSFVVSGVLYVVTRGIETKGWRV